MSFQDYLQRLTPHMPRAPLMEKVRSGIAGGAAILLLGWILHHLPQLHYPVLMLGSIAASAVLLFAAPHTPMAQPWNLIVGHLVSGFAGWCISLIVADPFIAAGMAVGMAILLMYLLDALHPPGAATALTMVLSAAQYQEMGLVWALCIIFANAGFALLLAILINAPLPNRRYPMPHTAANTAVKPGPFINIEAEDMAWAREQMGSATDIGEDELAKIYALALEHAQSARAPTAQK